MVDLEPLPFEIENIIAKRARMGLIALATDHVIEHELNDITHHISGAQIYTSRVPMLPQVTPTTLQSMKLGLASTAETLLPGTLFDVIAYGCTSASVLIGEKEVSAAIQSVHTDVPITTPITACIAAAKTLNVKKIGLLTPYIESINLPIRDYFRKHGIDVVKSATFLESDDNQAGLITPKSIKEAVLSIFSNTNLDLLFISCTSLRAAKLIPELESLLGTHVTSSNHALAWHMLRLSGIDDSVQNKGNLFLSQLDKNK